MIIYGFVLTIWFQLVVLNALNNQKKEQKMTNDIQLLDHLRADGWNVLGFGFIDEDTFTAKTTNERLWNAATPWESWLACPSLDDKKGFWLSTKEF